MTADLHPTYTPKYPYLVGMALPDQEPGDPHRLIEGLQFYVMNGHELPSRIERVTGFALTGKVGELIKGEIEVVACEDGLFAEDGRLIKDESGEGLLLVRVPVVIGDIWEYTWEQ